MNVRIVAYRPPDTTTTNDTAYELDLQEAPNISLNFQFSDIKEPETRKGSYSQTFKLPFTENNNEFFQNWYNVNLETLVFNTTKKFNVVVFVGSTPQFEGILKLQAVYTKARQYEIVIMANTADLFAEIGDKKVVDAIGSELNHVYSYDNIKLSWEGGSSSFLNTSSVSLRDSDAGVQKVMYPMTVSEVDKFYFGGMTAQGTGIHLNMNQATFSALDSDTEAADKMTSITQLKPAVQLKAVLKLIIANAGFSYTSSFIDGSYFGKIFMTTCNTLDSVVPPILNLLNFPGGLLDAESDGFGTFTGFNGATIIGANEWVDAVGFSDSNDNQGALLADGQTFQFVSPMHTGFNLQIYSMRSTDASEPSTARARMIPVVGGVPQYESDGILEAEDVNLSWSTGGATQDTLNPIYFAFSTQTPIVGAQYRIQVCVTEDVVANVGASGTFQFTGGSGITTKVDAQWFDYSQNPLGNTIDIAACIDPNLTQKDFLKDILERFNMVIIADPSDPTKLLIEPYTDYLAGGSIKNWTEKLDVSKEIVVKDTSSLQKKIINLSDLEDVDLLNKLTAEFNPSDNVWGKYYETNTTNEFATGELKNNSIFAPFRVEDVYRDSSGEINPLGPGNLAVHYVFSYENTPDGVVDVLKNTKPKIFYYRGDPTPIQTYASADTVSIFMHTINYGTIPATRTAFEFTEYPVCTAWDVDTGASTYTYTLTSANKSLFWGFAPPDNPDNQIFNFNGDNINSTWSVNTLYGLYWSSYLNATYSSEARLMECYLNLNEVDIYSFKFNDEIFIKDTYWRIINIHNYQVGNNVSTKVVLLKSIDTLGAIGSMPINLGAEASYLPPSSGNNLYLNNWYLWCPENNPGCTPSVSAAPYTGVFADANSCENLPNAQIDKTLDYDSIYSSYPALDGLIACVQVQGNENNPYSLPVLKQITSALSALSRPAIKSYFKAKLNKNFVRGSANTKFSKLMIPQTEDDLGIKYVSKFTNMPQVSGESHKLIMLATTTNIQTVASYIQGDNKKLSIPIPDTSNMMIQINGMATIVSNSNVGGAVGVTEQFIYYTAFRNINNSVTQIGDALGKRELVQVESGSSNSSLEITSADDTETGGKKLVINAKSTADNTVKVFTLDVNITLQRIHSLKFDTNWALYQNGNRIQIQNNDFLIWN